MDALLPTVLATPEKGHSQALLAGLLELRRHLCASLLALGRERVENLQALQGTCTEVACYVRWEKDPLGAARLELRLFALAARGANNVALLHALGSLHRLFEELPKAWIEGRPPDAIERRMRRTEALLGDRNSQEIRPFTIRALELEDAASMAALVASSERP